MGKKFCGLVVFLLVVIFASVSFAQLPTGTILGTVKDASGGAVAGATVTIVNTDTNSTRVVTTGDDGAFRVPALIVGHYSVKTEKSGFNTETATGFTLEVAQELVANVTMQVGSSTQAVTVTGEAPVVDTSSSVLGAVVNEERVADLPLNGRNWGNLTLLQSGVTMHAETGGGSPTTTAGLYFSSNGASTRSNNYMLDGAPMVVFYGAVAASVTGSTLGVDGIKEYKVETTNFSADYGLSAGSQTTIVSKGGSNAFHGDAFDYLRNNEMDAANLFDSKLDTPVGKRLPPFKRNNFGASFGGPIRKDKTFFYAVFEGIGEAQGLTPNGTTAFTKACLVETNNPCATNPTTVASGSTPAYTTGTVNPIIFPLLQYLPAANAGSNAFSFPFNSPLYEQYGQIRFDQNFSDKDSGLAAYTIDHSDVVNVPKGGPNPNSADFLRGVTQFTRFAENHIFTPNVLNTARFSISRTQPGDNQTNPNYPCSETTGLTPCPTSFVAGFPTVDMGAISATGIIGLPASVQVRSNQTIFAWSDDLYYTKGRHAFKFGTLITRWKQYQNYFNGNRGSIGFASLANLLEGYPYSSISYSTPVTGATRDYLSGTFGAYAQDDYRITSRVTLNLGLRYEIMVPSIYEANDDSAGLRNQYTDQYTTIGPPVRNPGLLNFSPRFGFAWDVFGDGKTALRGGSSLLYDVNNLGSQVAEDGHGMPFGNTSNPQQGTTTSITGTGTATCLALPLTIPLSFPACALGNTLIGSAYAIKQPRIWTFNLNIQRQLPAGMALQVGYVGTRGQNIWNRGEGNPCIPTAIVDGIPNWTNPSGTICPNLQTPTASIPNPSGRINPYWGSMEFTNTNSRSYYNALQVSLTKKMTYGLEFQANYTWSRNIDLGSSTLGSDSNVTDETEGAVNPINELGNRGPAAFDVPQSLHVNLIYNLPKTAEKGFVGGVLNGWWVSSIIAAQTGVPFSPIMSNNRSDSGVLVNEGDRPDITPGLAPSAYTSGTSAGCGAGASAVAPGTKVGTTSLYFNPCLFSIQPTGYLGTESRNFLRGPNLFSGDFSVVKDTAMKYLGEAGQIEFRAEFFNILNHPILGLPNATIFSGAPQMAGVVAPTQPSTGAGVISTTLPFTTSRQIQIALKLIF